MWNLSQRVKKNLWEATKEPKLKRKYFFFGFTNVLGIFGVTLLATALPAVAKDLPKQVENSSEVYLSRLIKFPETLGPFIIPKEDIVVDLLF